MAGYRREINSSGSLPIPKHDHLAEAVEDLMVPVEGRKEGIVNELHVCKAEMSIDTASWKNYKEERDEAEEDKNSAAVEAAEFEDSATNEEIEFPAFTRTSVTMGIVFPNMRVAIQNFSLDTEWQRILQIIEEENYDPTLYNIVTCSPERQLNDVPPNLKFKDFAANNFPLLEREWICLKPKYEIYDTSNVFVI